MQHQEQHDQEAARLIAEAYTDDASAVTRYRDTTPPTPTGAAPVPQPGARAPMSQRATDISVMTLSVGVASLPLGGGAALVLWQLSSVDPAVLALAAAAPVGLAGALGIAARMIGRAVRDGAAALPPSEVHHHHTGPTLVQNTAYDQRTTRGVIARTGDTHRTR
ncbi:hypothetical protein [Streptomyces albidoflavus]|uniref:hypothetical protein n=1 Tax=Streptomyces albidoflavus TaxID=1886 RepID=UPI00052716C2|nr:hypothetical protein [Streptomyces albidoflavus]